ncbi:MAG: tRNA (N(6)-L-threonylcarbamoyladenosine(37)-C(2))-methylthiotransferase MtaB [Thermodesulfobacteriota bacterium]
MMTTISIVTLGCKVNQFESEAVIDTLEQRGYSLIPFEEGADITIINTCTVTHRADFQSRQMVRRAVRHNPESLIIVTGCYPQVESDAFLKMKGVHYVLGNKEKSQIPDLLPSMQKGQFPTVQVSDIQKEDLFSETPLYSFRHHTRAFLKIQDGCNAGCSYCIVPRARGRSRSLQPERVIENVKVLKKGGFKEVVLTGIHLGAYGLDLYPPFPLDKLISQMEKEETPGRIRLTSIEPKDFSPELISTLSESNKICPHLHISIQSGDDETLKRMNRDYDRSFLSNLVQGLYVKIPKLCIGADVIVGFPGETEEEFKSTYRLVESLPFSYLHVFPFSRRKGTPAFQFSQQVDDKEIKKRAEEMRELGQQKRQAFYRQFLNQELSVLVEDRKEEQTGRWKGLSRNYVPVLLADQKRTKKDWDFVNQEWTVTVTGLAEKGVVANLSGDSMDDERLTSLKEFEERLGHQFKEITWLDQALTHKSFVYETNRSSKTANEVLEFLGDSVLGLGISYLLLQRFPEAQEGTLSMMRSQLVKRSSLASLSKELQIEGYLLLGKSQQANGATESSILANAYEALIGAIFMDSGFNRALEIIQRHFESHLETKTSSVLSDDFKSLLQIYCQQTHGVSPQYRVLNESGPDHDKWFQASVTIKGEVKGSGRGKSKKEAEQDAARNALEELSTKSQEPIK